jgi:steroid delta-isomerase-like uncharacterized protein
MSTEDNKRIARRFLQVWGQASLGTVDELVAPNLSVFYPLMNAPIAGPEAFKQHMARVHTAVPDGAIDIEEEIAEGDTVVVRWRLRGTHQGEYLGRPPTGKPVTWTGITIDRIVAGKVVEERGEEDTLALVRQLGALPASGQAS